MAPTSNPASPRSPGQHQSPPYNGHQQHSPYNGQQQSPFNGHQQIPHNAYQQGPHNDHYFPGNQQGSLHDSMNLGVRKSCLCVYICVCFSVQCRCVYVCILSSWCLFGTCICVYMCMYVCAHACVYGLVVFVFLEDPCTNS